MDVYGGEALFGWCESVRGVGGAFVYGAPRPLLLSEMSAYAAEELADILARRGVPVTGVNDGVALADVFARAWRGRSGASSEVRMRQRLYSLERLDVPNLLPAGAHRLATAEDRVLVHDWFVMFGRHAPGPLSASEALVDERIDFGGIVVWETGGGPVSLAGRTRIVAGVSRVAPVYTPLEHRRRGYGAAVTAAVTRSALEAGARQVVLFTDLANATSNALYQRLGYRPVADKIMLSFQC